MVRFGRIGAAGRGGGHPQGGRVEARTDVAELTEGHQAVRLAPVPNEVADRGGEQVGGRAAQGRRPTRRLAGHRRHGQAGIARGRGRPVEAAQHLTFGQGHRAVGRGGRCHRHLDPRARRRRSRQLVSEPGGGRRGPREQHRAAPQVRRHIVGGSGGQAEITTALGGHGPLIGTAEGLHRLLGLSQDLGAVAERFALPVKGGGMAPHDHQKDDDHQDGHGHQHRPAPGEHGRATFTGLSGAAPPARGGRPRRSPPGVTGGPRLGPGGGVGLRQGVVRGQGAAPGGGAGPGPRAVGPVRPRRRPALPSAHGMLCPRPPVPPPPAPSPLRVGVPPRSALVGHGTTVGPWQLLRCPLWCVPAR